MVSLLMQFSLKFSTSGTASVRAVDAPPPGRPPARPAGAGSAPARRCPGSSWSCARRAAAAARPMRVGQVLGAGAQLRAPARRPDTASLERLTPGRSHRYSAPMPLGAWILWPLTASVSMFVQLDGHPHPGLHGVHMHDGAAVAALDLGRPDAPHRSGCPPRCSPSCRPPGWCFCPHAPASRSMSSVPSGAGLHHGHVVAVGFDQTLPADCCTLGCSKPDTTMPLPNLRVQGRPQQGHDCCSRCRRR